MRHVRGSNICYQQEPDGSWRAAMPIPLYGMISVSCPECGRSFFGFHTNTQLNKYEMHWRKFHDHRRDASWGGVTA